MTTTAWTVLAIALIGALVTATANVGAISGVLSTGQTQRITVTTNGDLGVVAGHVTTHATGPFGLSLGTGEAPETGWVVLAPEDATGLADATLTVTDETPFTDPNGATWLSREVTDGQTTAWVVPVGTPHEDPTLASAYNFAAIVDWSQVPQDADLTASYHESLDLTQPEGEGSTTRTA